MAEEDIMPEAGSMKGDAAASSSSFDLKELDGSGSALPKQSSAMDDDYQDRPKSSAELEAVYDIPVQVSAVLGKSKIQVNNLLKLDRGAVVELDRKLGEAIDIYANDRLVARGEVVVVEDRLGITMTEIIKSDNN